MWKPIAASVGGLAALAAAAAFLVVQVRGVYDEGAAAERAKWKAELAAQRASAMAVIRDAREEGRRERVAEVQRATERAENAEEALRRAQHDQPEFDQAMRADWPDGYFDSVCEGRGSDCGPPTGDDQR